MIGAESVFRAVRAKSPRNPRWCLRTLLLLTALPLGPEAAATVHTDSNQAKTNSWAFERFDCGCPPCDIICPIPQAFESDILVGRRDFPQRHVLFTPYGGQTLGNVSIFSLTRAPDTGYVDIIDPVFTGDVQVGLGYALKTKAGKYVLFTIYELNFDTFGIVYRYQDDGSILFPAYTPIQPTTWGRLKGLLEH